MIDIARNSASPVSLRASEPGHFDRGSPQGEVRFRELLDGLPAAVYTTDALGRITYYNEAAATLWGCRPELGKSEWSGARRLFWPDGTALAHWDSPMALAIRERRPIRGMEAIVERPDGTRVPFMPYPTPLFDASGNLTGAVNILVDITDRKRAEDLVHRTAAIVEFSDDAIISKDIEGVIQSWNAGAKRLFGYTAEEAIGRPVTILIPDDRLGEEKDILARIRRGERIEHYETVRRHKDGTLIDISLTVSPVKNGEGRVVGASKIARDITERRLAQERQHLLLREMDHRVKNLFSLAGGIVSLSARTATTPSELASAVHQRLAALARAHSLTLLRPDKDAAFAEQPIMLHALIRTMASPYEDPGAGRSRIAVSGSDIAISGSPMTSLALLLHEFTTNAAKYGALSVPSGHIDIQCSEDGDRFVLRWAERGGPAIEGEADSHGFGTLLARSTVEGSLGGEIVREWEPEGLTIRLSMARSRLAQ
jgi:PAS domain S-box-containing protein